MAKTVKFKKMKIWKNFDKQGKSLGQKGPR